MLILQVCTFILVTTRICLRALMLKKGIRVPLTEDPHKNLFSEKNLHDRTSQFTNSSPTHEHTGEDPAAKHALYDNKANKS